MDLKPYLVRFEDYQNLGNNTNIRVVIFEKGVSYPMMANRTITERAHLVFMRADDRYKVLKDRFSMFFGEKLFDVNDIITLFTLADLQFEFNVEITRL
jgi:hypothetical protein